MRVLRAWTGPMVCCVALLSVAGSTQEKQPQVRINYLNVCAPSQAEIHELEAALARIPGSARFAADFEVSRGRSTISTPALALADTETGLAPLEANSAQGLSSWVRIRREFSPPSPFMSVQYSMSVDVRAVLETLVFRLRESKDLQTISIEDRVSPAAEPATVLKTDTPANHIRIERFGKSSVALARCPAADQKIYEPLFRRGSEVLAQYRNLLGVRATVPADMRRLGITTGATAGTGHKKKSETAAPPALPAAKTH